MMPLNLNNNMIPFDFNEAYDKYCHHLATDEEKDWLIYELMNFKYDVLSWIDIVKDEIYNRDQVIRQWDHKQRNSK